MYLKYAHHYNVEKITLKKHKSQKTHFHFYLFWNSLNSKGWCMEPKVSYINVTWALCCFILPVTIDWWKEWIDCVEIKFYSAENIDWHYMQQIPKLNLIEFILIELKSKSIF
jgi:hypothetical protein